jgi:hypothetical protein
LGVLKSLLGKILRLEADGTIPEDNPFYRRTTGKSRAIWALGLRNPVTFAVQPGTGRMFINDVGGAHEEINVGVAGANYGWPTADHGPTKDPRFRGPIRWYKIRYTGAEAPANVVTGPADQRLTAGQPALFRVVAEGGRPLRLQWQRDGRDLPGANGPAYALAAVKRADSGARFRCVVRNTHGTAVSREATLTVIPSFKSGAGR